MIKLTKLLQAGLLICLIGGTLFAQQEKISDPQLPPTPTEEPEPKIKKKQFVTAANVREALFMASRGDTDRDAYLKQAGDLLNQPGADVKSTDAEGRTALHWAVLGATDADNKLAALYVDVAELLIAAGADVNAVDTFGNTPLDYQEVSGAEELREVLLESGALANNDRTARLNAFVSEISAAANAGNISKVRDQLKVDLPLSTIIPIKLTSVVSSRDSRAGDLVSAVVAAPVMSGNRIVIAPGTKIEGTVLFAHKSANRFERAQLILGFANLIDAQGAKARLALDVAGVDNARERVQDNRIVGVSYPNNALAQRKVSWGMRLIGAAVPALGYALEASTLVYAKKFNREIRYEPGTDMNLQIVVPAKIPLPADARGFPLFIPAAELVALAAAQPVRATTSDGEPIDVTNVLLLGSQSQIEAAFRRAGWDEASALSKKTGLETFAAILFKQGYDRAPFSDLYLNGQPPALTYQKQLNTFAKRNHIRLWKVGNYQGQDVWLGAATHDIGMGIALDKEKLHWFHTVDIRIDEERAKVMNDLLFSGGATAYALVDRPQVPQHNQTAGGNPRDTDGRILILKFN